MSRAGYWGRQRDAGAIAAFVEGVWPRNGAAGGNGCVHHWMLEQPKQGASHGICKLCGAVKDFPSIPPVSDDQHVFSETQPVRIRY
jgi:hypothetical protein